MKPESTTKRGNDFRDSVAALLSENGYIVQKELLVDHKNVDILATYSHLNKSRTIAVEVKNYKNPLTKFDFEKILASHFSLLKSGAINELLVVSLNPDLSGATQKYLHDTNEINHLTIDQLQNSLMDFKAYLHNAVLEHEKQGLENYYVQQSSTEHGDTNVWLNDWISSDEHRPVAIIAGYGMGKTSLARHLSYKLANDFLAGNISRIPILVSLGTISQEQSLSGLIGTCLAGSSYSVKNYNFPLFDKMNKKGRFVILLDGFDEMKHMMTYSDFTRNFDELNKLVCEKSKVILLGRPSAFLSDNERSAIIFGKQKFGKITLNSKNSPKYIEHSIAKFTPAQVNEFISRYIAFSMTNNETGFSNEYVDKRMEEVRGLAESELLSRPVHTKMFVDVAANSDTDLSNLSRFDLYNYFINYLINREVSKLSRGWALKSDDRRIFACDLAWFLWTDSTSEGGGCRLQDLPDSLFQPYVPEGFDPQEVKRDLLAGSFLEEKEAGTFYFAHRSFQEFLVAEYIWNFCDTGFSIDEQKEFVNLLQRVALTEEVLEFLIEGNSEETFASLSRLILTSRVSIEIEFLESLLEYEGYFTNATQKTSSKFQEFDAIATVYYYLSSHDGVNQKYLAQLKEKLVEKCVNRPKTMMQALFYIYVFSQRDGDKIDDTIRVIFALLFYRLRKEDYFTKSFYGKRSANDYYRSLVFDCIRFEFSNTSKESLIVTFDISTFLEICEKKLSNKIEGYPSIRRESLLRVVNQFDEFTKFVNEEDIAYLRRYAMTQASRVAREMKKN